MRPCVAALLAILLVVPATAQQGPAPKSMKAPAHAKPAPLAPLTPHERALQLLSRFTFGPRPGDIEQLIAMGEEKWLAQQFDPANIPDPDLGKRLNDFPSLTMSPQQALLHYPSTNILTQLEQNKLTMPTDPMLVSIYEAQLYKYKREKAASTAPPSTETDEEKNARKKADQDKASRIAGDLFILPKNQRIAALNKLPVEDRVLFVQQINAGGPLAPEKTALYADMTPRERMLFNIIAGGTNVQGLITQELQQAKLLRAMLSERQLQEVMTDFWFNHFNVDARKDSDQWYTTSYERDIIRPHALGKFRDLLLATAQSPAMMVYLDNWLSIGPHSLANGVNPANPKSKQGNRGLNENYGREVMELHTLGVDGGYTQADVTALSAVLTGWTVDNPGNGGSFLFDVKRHEPGEKQWFGHTIGSADASAAAAKQEGIEALTILAAAPQTAHHISWLIAQRFIADDPPKALIDRMAARYLATDGDIKELLLVLVHSPEFNSRRYFRNKVKTPMEFLASAYRATGTVPDDARPLINTLNQMGMPQYQALPPTGYYLTADQWMNTHALIDRLTFATQLTSGKYSGQKFDASHVLAAGILESPPAPRSTTPKSPTLVQRVLEQALLGEPASAKTENAIQSQMNQQPDTKPIDTLNQLTGLILGSPDFQLH